MQLRKEFFNRNLSQQDLGKKSKKESPTQGIIQYKLNDNDTLIFSGYNSSSNSILGIDCQQFMGKSIQETLPALNNMDIPDLWKEVAITGNSWSIDNAKYCDSNISGNFEINVHQVEQRKIIVLFQDTADRKVEDLESITQTKFLENIYNNVEHLIFVMEIHKNGSFKFVDVNPAYEIVAEVTADEIRGKSPSDFTKKVSKESIEEVISRYHKCVNEKRSLTFEEMVMIDGIERWWLTTINPLLDKNNRVYQIIGTSIEITTRKMVEQELRNHDLKLESIIEERVSELKENESRFRHMAEGLYNGLRIYDDRKLVNVNKAFCDISGYTEEELKKMHSIDLVCKKDKKMVQEHILSPKKTPDEIVFCIVSKNGNIKKIRNRYITSEKENGEMVLYIISNDVTESEKIKEQLVLQSTALNAAANGISISDKTGKMIWVNDAFIELTGYERKELIGNYPNILKSGLHDDNHYKNLWATIKKGDVWRGEFINKKKNGELYYDETTITPVMQDNKISNFVEIKQDISNRKNYEMELKSREEYYRSLFENSHNTILVSDFVGNILEMNNTAKKMLGLNGERMSELNFSQFIVDSNEYSDFLLTLNEKGFVNNFSTQFKKKDNTIIDCLINATLHKSDADDSEIFQAILLDITDHVNAKNILENALIESKKANKLKSEFLATMSHEIRTPINIILSYIGLIKSDFIDKADEDLQDLFPSMEKAGRRIIRTIDLLLNVAELNAGTYECKFKDINLYEGVLENIYLDYKKEAQAKGLEFNLLKQTDKCFVKGDEYTITEIFKNIVDNAIKYTSNGKIELILRDNKFNSLEIEVRDTGIGIDDSYLPQLFEPFTQEETGYTRKYDGNGLGMALVKQYVKLNNAEISVRSAKGIGTSFTITFKK
jgi:PAS domain S-box-containing protein